MCLALRSPASSVGCVLLKISSRSVGVILLFGGLYAEMIFSASLLAISTDPIVISKSVKLGVGCIEKIKLFLTTIAVPPCRPSCLSVLCIV